VSLDQRSDAVAGLGREVDRRAVRTFGEEG
jgi:hypothetical protein